MWVKVSGLAVMGCEPRGECGEWDVSQWMSGESGM